MKALVADTGGLLRALAQAPSGGPAWPEYREALVSARSVLVPALILTEVEYFLRGDRPSMRRLLADILDPGTRYELELPSAPDLARAAELDARHADLGLGLVDGSVAALAERRGVLRVLTTDRRHFSAIRVGPRLDRALELLP